MSMIMQKLFTDRIVLVTQNTRPRKAIKQSKCLRTLSTTMAVFDRLRACPAGGLKMYARYDSSVKQDIQANFDKIIQTILSYFNISSISPAERSAFSRRHQELRPFWRWILTITKTERRYGSTTDNSTSPFVTPTADST